MNFIRVGDEVINLDDVIYVDLDYEGSVVLEFNVVDTLPPEDDAGGPSIRSRRPVHRAPLG